MGSNVQERLAYACVVALVAPLGFATKFYAGPAATWVAHYAGGFLYVLFWIFLSLSLAPRASPKAVAFAVLAITSLLEVLQLWHPPFLERIRATFLGRALIGSSFAWWDFVYYGVAALAAPKIARWVQTLGCRAVTA